MQPRWVHTASSVWCALKGVKITSVSVGVQTWRPFCRRSLLCRGGLRRVRERRWGKPCALVRPRWDASTHAFWGGVAKGLAAGRLQAAEPGRRKDRRERAF